MNKLLKSLLLGLGVLASINASALNIQANKIEQSLIMCRAGYIESADLNRCMSGFGSVSVKEYAESKGYRLESYDAQISQGVVYIVMKVSK